MSQVSILRSLLIFAICSVIAIAQSDVGSLSGIVRDPSNAVIPKAEAVVKNEATNEEHTVTTNDCGYYTATNLPPSLYTVTVSASRPERVFQRRNRGPEQQSKSHYEKILWVPHLPSHRTGPISLAWQAARARTHPQIPLTNPKSMRLRTGTRVPLKHGVPVMVADSPRPLLRVSARRSRFQLRLSMADTQTGLG
jgi:hypothetical protein